MKYILITSSIFFNFFLLSAPTDGVLISNESYITGEDGVIRMYINIVGNVKNPGTYLVYDGIDFMSAISLAGGFMQGSNLKKVKVFRKNNNFEYINLDKHLAGSSSFNDFKLFPHDTIYIEQKKISEILFSSNIPYIVLGILNVVLTIDRTD